MTFIFNIVTRDQGGFLPIHGPHMTFLFLKGSLQTFLQGGVGVLQKFRARKPLKLCRSSRFWTSLEGELQKKF